MTNRCNCSADDKMELEVLDTEGLIYLLSLLRIGVANEVEKVGGIDNAVVKDNTIILTYKSGEVVKLEIPKATNYNYGLVKLSSSTASDLGDDSSYAATPKAVKAVRTLASQLAKDLETRISNNALIVGDLRTRVNDVITNPIEWLAGSQAKKEAWVAALLKAGANINIAQDGTVSLKITSLDSETIKKFNNSIIAQNKGLIINTEGKLEVDSSVIDTKEEILSGTNVREKVTSAKYRNWYVDPAGADTIVEGRGLSKALPFKTIQACVNYINENIDLGAYAVTINIAGGTYTETLALGQQSRTTGYISFVPYEGATVTIYNKLSYGYLINCIGGDYRFSNMTLKLEVTGTDTSLSRAGYVVYANNATVRLISTNIQLVDSCVTEGSKTNAYCIMSTMGGNVYVSGATSVTFENDGKLASTSVFAATYQGQINFTATNIEADKKITLTGKANILFNAWNRGMITTNGGATYTAAFYGNIQAKKYELSTGSSVYLAEGALTNVSGTTSGELDKTTYCWYQEA